MSESNFLPYVLNVIQPLKELMLQDSLQEVPCFKLNPNSDFHLISSNVASLSVTQTLTSDQNEQTAEIFNSISEYVQDPRNLVRLQVLEHASKNFAAILENSYLMLTNLITPTVDDLRTKIENRYIELIRHEKAEDLLSETQASEPTEADYRFLTWDKLKSPSKQNEIIDIACTNANVSNPQLSLINLNYILDKAYFSSHQLIELPDTTMSEVSQRLTSTFATQTYGISEEQVRNFISVILDPKVYFTGVGLFKRSINDFPNLSEYLITANQFTNQFMVMNEAALRLISDLVSPEVQEKLATNLEAVKNTIYAMQYWLLVTKEIRLKGKLILGKDIINQEAYEDFIREGHSIIDIHNYIKAFHLESSIPKDGISAEIIMKTNYRDKLEQAAIRLKANATFIKSKCLIHAYELVMRQFITDTLAVEKYPKLKEDSVVKKFSQLANSRANVLGGEISRVDSVLYDIIINTFYQYDLVGTLYKYLGTNFDNLAKNSDTDITEVEINKAQCWATIEMLTDYLFNVLVETKNTFKPA